MAFGIVTIVHIVLFVLLIIELGLTGNVVDKTTNFGFSAPSSFAFLLFDSIWSLLVVVYLAVFPIYIAKAYHSLAAVILLVITSIFWFAGSIAMAAYIGVPNCHGSTFCQTTQAAVAFGFFLWAIFTGLTVLEGLSTLRGGAHADKGTTPSTV